MRPVNSPTLYLVRDIRLMNLVALLFLKQDLNNNEASFIIYVYLSYIDELN